MAIRTYAEFKVGVVESGYLLGDGRFNGDDEVHAFENIKALLEHLSVRLLEATVERNALQQHYADIERKYKGKQYP
jgi:hypothetical protein